MLTKIFHVLKELGVKPNLLQINTLTSQTFKCDSSKIRAALCRDRGGNYKKPNKLQVDDVLMEALICLVGDTQDGLSGYDVQIYGCWSSVLLQMQKLIDLGFFSLLIIVFF